MNSFDTILVYTDLSAAGNNAVRRAALLAREHDARLSILHVIGRNGAQDAGNDRSRTIVPASTVTQVHVDLRRLFDELSETFDVSAHLVVKIGDPLDVLMSESRGASLVVLGQRAGRSIKDMMFGTRAGRLLDTCARPVLIVKQAVDGPYRRVLTGFDFTRTSEAAALTAAVLAPGADLHVTHVFHSKQDDALRRTDVPAAILRKLRAREEAGVVARMQRRLVSIGFDSRELCLAVIRGSSGSAILYQERTQDADLVAVGRQLRSKWLDTLLGSVSHRMLACSHADLLVVPGPAESAASSHAVAQPARLVEKFASID